MAFYHSNSCDCPVGNCDCGSETLTYQEHLDKARQLIYELTPKDVYLMLSEGTLHEYIRPQRSWHPKGWPNCKYIGQIDPVLLSKDALKRMAQLEGYLSERDIIPRSEKIKLLYHLGRDLSESMGKREKSKFVYSINSSYRTIFERRVSDWTPIW